MTTSQLVLEDWALKPIGKAARIGIAVGGMTTATLVLLMATLLPSGTWMFVLTGLALVATSIRAARYPTLIRLGVVAVNLAAIALMVRTI